MLIFLLHIQTKYNTYNIPKRNDILRKVTKYLMNELSDSELIALDIDDELKAKSKKTLMIKLVKKNQQKNQRV